VRSEGLAVNRPGLKRLSNNGSAADHEEVLLLVDSWYNAMKAGQKLGLF
jgi:hypothetical protein